MKIIIFDFEVFKKDTLLGAIVLSDGNKEIFQSWNLEEIKSFYNDHIDDIWVGHNNEFYDNFILQAIIKGQDPKKINDEIIDGDKHYRRLTIKLNFYDLMKFHQGSLKVIEAFMGKNISETEVDFDLDRALTEEEKKLTESYNRDDLNQTLEDFIYLQDEFTLKLDLVKEFNLPLSYLCATEAKIAAKALLAQKIDGIESLPIYPKMYSQLQIKNQDPINFYMNREYTKKGAELVLNYGGTIHHMKAGGLHGAIDNCYFKEVYYLDVSGYYNLVMINFDLLSRAIPPEGRKLYEYMYHEQLRLKKINPRKRQVYKIILLAVFGAQSNEYCEFYDPYQGDLVRMVGQMFLIDLLEKLEPIAKIIQSNTDGIMCVPLEGHLPEEIKKVVDEWQERTGFVLKFDKIYNLYQRDVNNYIYQHEDGSIETKGEAVKYYGGYDTPYKESAYMSKEPLIISKCIVNYCIYNKTPEETINEEKHNLRMFQSICKKGSFDWLEYVETNLETGETSLIKLQKVNRAFALKSDSIKGVIYKRNDENKQSKTSKKVVTKSKMGGVPDNLFIFNHDLNEMSEEVFNKIDFDYYVNRAYERINEFINTPQIKGISVYEE